MCVVKVYVLQLCLHPLYRAIPCCWYFSGISWHKSRKLVTVATKFFWRSVRHGGGHRPTQNSFFYLWWVMMVVWSGTHIWHGGSLPFMRSTFYHSTTDEDWGASCSLIQSKCSTPQNVGVICFVQLMWYIVTHTSWLLCILQCELLCSLPVRLCVCSVCSVGVVQDQADVVVTSMRTHIRCEICN